jgi:hypothetical protein
MPTDRSSELEEIDTGQVYLVSGSYLQKMLDALRANRPLPGHNITTEETDGGVIINGADTPGGV